MKLEEDDSCLSAYLDGQLAPEGQVDLESRLADDPELAARLAGLVLVRDAVAGLPRPEIPCSVVAAVMARVDAGSARVGRRPYYWLATAASVVFALILTHRTGGLNPGRPAAVAGPGSAAAVPPATRASAVVPTRAIATALVDLEDEDEHPPAPPGLGPAYDPTEAPRRQVFGWTSRPGLRRVLIVLDVMDPTAGDRVNALLVESARKSPEFGRLTLAEGIVIDPEYPGGAEVFAALMDDSEREQFVGRASREFTGDGLQVATIIDSPALDPGLGLRLAQVDALSVGTGRRAAGLVDPPAARIAAQASHLDRPLTVDAPPDPPFPGVPGGDMIGLRHDAVLPKELTHPSPRPATAHPSAKVVTAPAADPTSPAPRPRAAPARGPVLVWVTARSPSPSRRRGGEARPDGGARR